MIDATLIAQVERMSVADRVELLEVVWGLLPADELPVTEAERTLLDERLADAERRPEDQSPWAEVRARLRRQLP